jgi:hypothetical protein
MKRLISKLIVVLGIVAAIAAAPGCEKLTVDNLPPEHGHGAEHAKPAKEGTTPAHPDTHGTKDAPKPAAH